MDSDKLFLNTLYDRQRVCRDKGIITFTKFLDLNGQSVFSSMSRDCGVLQFLFGGYAQAERKIGVFVPASYGITPEDEFEAYAQEIPLCVIRIDKDRFSSLSHRDYLGAIMNTGITRESIGDIVTDENGAYVVAFDEIGQYLKNELSRIGRATVKTSSSDFSFISAKTPDTKDSFVTDASLRLDNIVSAAFSLSRKNAAAEISAGKVFVNDILTEKADYRVPVGAKIVLRGKGKAVLSEQTGKSRKDRPQIVIKRYL